MGCGEKVLEARHIHEHGGLMYEVNSDDPFTGKVVEYWPNGEKKTEGEVLNGMLHGKVVYWYEDGQKYNETEYRDNKPHGKETGWYKTGQKEGVGYYRDGKVEGKTIMWYKSGQKRKEKEFHNSELISEQCWDENGNPIDCEELPKQLTPTQTLHQTPQDQF